MSRDTRGTRPNYAAAGVGMSTTHAVRSEVTFLHSRP